MNGIVARLFKPCVPVLRHMGWYSSQYSKGEAMFRLKIEERFALAYIDGVPSIAAVYRGDGLKSRATIIATAHARMF